MYFPKLIDIASKSVVTVTNDSTLKTAIDCMISSEHRNVIVSGDHFYRVLQAQDVLFFQSQKVPLSTLLNTLDLPHLPVATELENVIDAMRFLKEGVQYIGVVDEQAKLLGLITHTDLVNSIDPELMLENFVLGDVLTQHRPDLWFHEDLIAEEAISTMVKHRNDCVLTVDSERVIKGIFTTKDVLRLYEQESDLSKPISHYVTSPVETLPSNTSVKQAIDFVKAKHYKRVVVADESGRLGGVILQERLISMSYNKWASLMNEFQRELQVVNAMLEEKSQHYKKLAAIDPLTGLYNRYKFSEVFASEFVTMQQRQSEMALMILDLDLFKQINDVFGHNKGDEVLVSVSQILIQGLRQKDVVGRWGGEEFLALLPTANLAQARVIAENLRHKVAQLTICDERPVTISIGIASVKHDDSLESVISRADKALYQSKNNGRNQVSVCE